MNLKMKLAALSLAAGLALSGCAAGSTASSTTDSSATTTSSSASATITESAAGSTAGSTIGTGTLPEGGMPAGEMPAGDPGGGVDASSVATEDELIALIQEAYGDAGLDLHRGHMPVQDVLDEVLAISHEELHVRMEAGQNLSDIADELGVGTQTLVNALVESWSPAIDNLLAAGTITQEEADAYTAALEEAFTYRVTWDGEEATPTFDGLTA
ncbi:hypothetical protein [Arthrobacter ruber]|uniref:hypothetical protein n=1 Tax=Arthrobacter ruber TaxID=1258893 RepID=UPI0012FFE41B|nr:hypothetical protein [Arthrobacter ruber]